MAKSIKIVGGEICPKCAKPMQRNAHKPEWKPKVGQPYYFTYWDTCRPCRHLQHYEAAKVWIGDAGARIDAIKSQLGE